MTDQEDLDYADNIGLLSSKHQDALQKAERLSKQLTLLVSKLTQGRPKFWGRTQEWTTQSWLMENSQHYWSQSQHQEDLSSEEEH